DEAIVLGDDAANSAVAAAPGYRPAIAVPARTTDQVVAVAQGRDAVANPIIGIASDEAIVLRDHAANSAVAAAPGFRPPLVVPVLSPDLVGAGAQGRDPAFTTRRASDPDEAIVLGDDAANSAVAAAPGHRPAFAVPRRTLDQVVAVAQERDAEGANP